MATNIVIRLEFQHIFPDLDEKSLEFYLSNISYQGLLNVNGALLTNIIDYYNFFSDFELQSDILNRVENYKNSLRKEGIYNPIVSLTSNEGRLRLLENILSNIEQLKNEDNFQLKQDDEINIFKALLIINTTINNRKFPANNESNLDNIIDANFSLSFPVSDLGLFEGNKKEFGKNLYATLVKFDNLLLFINNNMELSFLAESLCNSFNVKSLKELEIRVTEFIAVILSLISKPNGHKIYSENQEQINFLESLCNIKDFTVKDEDFTSLKENPLLKLDENNYSVIDFYFVIDKFFKGIRFVLKKSYVENKKVEAGDFFRFFNSEYSEKTLMKNILDDIFSKNYFVKKKSIETTLYEPDYYCRFCKTIFLFEFKDILIPAKVKNSGDINQINEVLKQKLLHDGTKDVGIGQLISTIETIVNNKFLYDDIVNQKKNLTIFPILLLNDRIFQVPGFNYKLNKWYKNEIKKRLGVKYNPIFIKDLITIDLDTFIYHADYFRNQFPRIRDNFNFHLKKMNTIKKSRGKTIEEFLENHQKNIEEMIMPFNLRFDSNFDTRKLLKRLIVNHEN